MCHQTRRSSHAGQHLPRFFLGKNNRYFPRSAGSDDVVDPRHPFFKHLLIEEQERRKRLILRGGCNVHLCCQMAQKSLHFICTHFLRVADAMKPDVTLYPLHISRFSAWTVAARAHGFADLVEQFWRSWRIALGQSGVWHLAAFLAGLPCKRQEIDDKLQSN